jgi:hypothetical protein
MASKKKPPQAAPQAKPPEGRQKLEQLKKEIRELYANYQTLYTNYHTRRLELGMKLLNLQKMLAKPGVGEFKRVATQELGIPHSTVYDLIDFAKEEIERVRLSENRTDDRDDTVATVDFSSAGIADFLRLAYPEGVPARKPPGPKPYIQQVQLHFIFDRDTRLAVAAAWKIIRAHPVELKELSKKIAEEVIDAAAKIEKNSHN